MLVWQFMEIATGRPGFLDLCIFGGVKNFGICGCCNSRPFAICSVTVINLSFVKRLLCH